MTSDEQGDDDGGHRLAWRSASVDGRVARYGVGGSGRPVLFLHGWGLTSRTYQRSLDLLVAAGMRVYAPCLPGFGGTAALPSDEVSIAGYARWVEEFAQAVGIEEPVVVVGHSFGGGVAIRLAHDAPDLVARLILVNSVGGSAWLDGRGVVRPMRERPLWDWGMQLRTELRPSPQLTAMLPRIVREAVPNVLRNPGTVWRVATLARTADLAVELAELRHRNLEVAIAWSDEDTVTPRAAFAALCAALGDPMCVTVPGRHGWLIDQPHLFAKVMAEMLAEPAAAESLEPAA